jgi:mannose-6-phosphate isomerase
MEPLLQILRDQPDSGGLKTFFGTMMTLPPSQKSRLTKQAFDRARNKTKENDAYQWIVALMESYPEDIGVLSPLFLNLVLLQPGQALYLPAAGLHAYLEGVGIELMANSDNVLRGGLTPKHIDVDELLAVLDFEERTPRVLSQRPGAAGERIYECPAREFTLSVLIVNQNTRYSSPKERSVEILLCTTGAARIRDLGSGEVTALNKGNAALVPAAVSAYALSGNATVYKAAVPI